MLCGPCSDSLFTRPTWTRQYCLVLSQPSFDEFCLVSTQFPISKFLVILSKVNVFETEQLQIGNWVETRQNSLVLSAIVFTPPSVSAV